MDHKGKTVHDWIECVISRKDRKEPTVVREFFDEVIRELGYKTPWDTHPNRMHRHKALIQCARIAFGFAGIYDEDEAERIIEMGSAEVVSRRGMPEDTKNKVHDAVLTAIENNDPAALSQAFVGFDADEYAELNRMFNSAQRSRMEKIRKMVTVKTSHNPVTLNAEKNEPDVTEKEE